MGQRIFSSLALLDIESDLNGALVPEDIVHAYMQPLEIAD